MLAGGGVACSTVPVTAASFRTRVIRVAATCVLVGLAWMHGATVPTGDVCAGHQAPAALSASAGTLQHEMHAHAQSAKPHGAESIATMHAVANIPLVASSAPSGSIGSHLAMACLAILVGLLLLSTAPLSSRRLPRWRQRRCTSLVRVMRWPHPPDLAQLSILRT